jgi:hypothetical protein
MTQRWPSTSAITWYYQLSRHPTGNASCEKRGSDSTERNRSITMSALRVFITYSHKDDTITSRLVEDLQAAGMDVWVDRSNLTDGSIMQSIDAEH